MSKSVGKSVTRVDAYEKATGRAKYVADLCDQSALVARILHATIAHGYVKSIDTTEAEAVPGVVKVLTCFNVPDYRFPTAGHPWSTDPAHQDVADRLLLNRHVRYYGDDIAAVIAENEIAAAQAVRALKVEYEELPFVLDVQKAMEPDAPQIHEDCPGNVLKHTDIRRGDYQTAIQEPGLIRVEGWYDTPTVQHCHIENHGCFAYEEAGRVVVVTSTQIPHIVRRVIGQAMGIGWGSIRVIKPYIGGGFGNKQEVLYEPLNAWLTTQVGGRCVRLDVSREETFQNTRSRHPISFDVAAAVDGDMRLMARSCTAVSNQGGYASHGHSIVANAVWDPKAFRLANLMPLGYVDPFNGITCHSTGLAECIEKGADFIGWVELREKYKEQSGPVRRGVGMACFSYKTGVYPISLETASARLVLNQDGTVQLHLGATEIGQGRDTVFSQMAAETTGISFDKVYIVSTQDTGKAIKKVGEEFREKLLAYAAELFPDASGLDIRERQVVDGAGEALISLADLAMNAFYSLEHSVHITAEDTNHCKENTFAFGCCFAEVEVDIPVGKVRVLRIVNVHDSGKLINPALAEAQVHGGMSMGIGYALTEEMKFDPKTGRLLNGNLLDYKMPTSMDHPELTALFVETDDPSGPFGNKALGEPPTIPVAPAIRNAVLQATGVAVNTLPLSPQKLVEEFTRGGLI